LGALQESRATLYGYKSSENSVTVVTFLVQVNDEEYENILPAGLDSVGSFALNLDDVSSDTSLALVRDAEGKFECYVQEDDRFRESEYSVTDDLEMATLRIRTKIPLQLSSKHEETDILLDKMVDKINSDAAAYLLDRSRAVVLSNGYKSVLVGAPQDVTVEELAQLVGTDGIEEDDIQEKKVVDHSQPLDFKLYWASVAEESDGSVPHCAPLIYHQKRNNLQDICQGNQPKHNFCFTGVNPMVCLSLSFEALSVIPWSEPAENLGPILSTSVTRQLKLFVEDLKEQLHHMAVEEVSIPEIFHFYPEPLKHYVTLVYHPHKTDEQLGNFF
jgi:hypothetical protein